MKKLGRILLLIVSIVMVASAAPLIIMHWQALNAAGWNDITNYPDKFAHLSSIIGQILNIFFALAAFVAFIRGKASVRLIIYAAIILVPADIFFINAYKTGLLSDWRYVVEAVIGYAVPITYALGTIFVLFGR